MTSTIGPSLTAEELDDLIYYARTGDLTALKAIIAESSNSHSVPARRIIHAATFDRDADDSQSSSGCCLLHWPAANGNQEVLNYLLSLLGSTRDTGDGKAKPTSDFVNHKNKSGNTPLHWAAVNGHMSCVKALVAAGGDPVITNDAGHDSLFEADRSGKEGGREVAEWILANCVGLGKGTNENDGSVKIVPEDVSEGASTTSDATNAT
jgi:uncharacterized protein